jgi:hypothetical protein
MLDYITPPNQGQWSIFNFAKIDQLKPGVLSPAPVVLLAGTILGIINLDGVLNLIKN